MPEVWNVSADNVSATVTGRERVSLAKKLNPIWWLKNDSEQTLDTAPWYMPTEPQWWRQVCWQFRNPFQNLRAFVLGVQDKNYTVTGRAPVMTVQRDDIGDLGWQWCTLRGGDLWMPRYFVSYSGSRIVFYAGTQPTGFFGTKLNIRF